MSSELAREGPVADAESGQPEHPPPPPSPPPENPPREEDAGVDKIPRSGTEGNSSGADAGGSGDTEAGASFISSTIRIAVIEALSDPAVVRQLAMAVTNSSMCSASASSHDGKLGTIMDSNV